VSTARWREDEEVGRVVGLVDLRVGVKMKKSAGSSAWLTVPVISMPMCSSGVALRKFTGLALSSVLFGSYSTWKLIRTTLLPGGGGGGGGGLAGGGLTGGGGGGGDVTVTVPRQPNPAVAMATRAGHPVSSLEPPPQAARVVMVSRAPSRCKALLMDRVIFMILSLVSRFATSVYPAGRELRGPEEALMKF
jgi:hypothetical protein